MQLRDAIQEFMLECKVRRLVPRTIDNYGKHLRYLTNYLAEECQLEKLEEVKSAHIKKFLLMYCSSTLPPPRLTLDNPFTKPYAYTEKIRKGALKHHGKPDDNRDHDHLYSVLCVPGIVREAVCNVL